MEKRIDMLGLWPEVVFPLLKGLEGSIIGGISIPLAVKITENDSIVGHFQGTPSNPGGNYSIDKTTRTYYDGTTINLMNVGLGGGLRYDLGRVSIGGSIIAHFMDLSPGSKGRAEKPKFFRIYKGYTIWRK